jgi:hypothetical protein
MAGLENTIVIKTDYRPCIVKDRKALFHRWSDKSKVLAPSYTIGGHRGGEERLTVGIVEYEDGVVTECYPWEIRFCDDKFKEFCFSQDKEGR